MHHDSDVAIVDGRVLERSGDRCTIEFEADGLPPVGESLAAEGGVLEVIHHTNPTEVRAVCRAGHAPGAGTVVKVAGALVLFRRLNGGPPRVWVAPGALEAGEARLLSVDELKAIGRSTMPLVRTPIWFGHPGVDILAPALDRDAIALCGEGYDDIGAGLAIHLEAARAGGHVVLWASAGLKSPLAELVAEDDLHLGPTDLRPGPLALIPRAVASLSCDLLRRGRRLVVVLDDPELWGAAWSRADGMDTDARVTAAAELKVAIEAIARAEGPQRHVVALMPRQQSAPILSPTAESELMVVFDAVATFEEGALVPEETHSEARVSEVLEARRRALAESVIELMQTAVDVGDYARIFGEMELTESQRELWEVARELRRVLCARPDGPVPVEEVMETCLGIIAPGSTGGA